MIRKTDQRGFTIVEVVATGIISVVAFLALYIGIIYAEGRANRDYHTRSAMLIASGELDIQSYWLHMYKRPNTDRYGMETLIEKKEGLAIYGQIDISIPDMTRPAVEQYNDKQLFYYPIVVTVTWPEPSLEGKVIRATMQEDYYDQNLITGGHE